MEGTAGAYGVLFVDGSLKLLGVIEKDISGYVLLSKNVVSLEANYYIGRNLLNLASAPTRVGPCSSARKANS